MARRKETFKTLRIAALALLERRGGLHLSKRDRQRNRRSKHGKRFHRQEIDHESL